MERFEKGIVIKSMKIPEGDDLIIVVEGAQNESSRNLLRIDSAGSIVWRAAAPRAPGGYTDVAFRGEILFAKSWSGFKIALDPRTGASLDEQFVK